MKQVPRLKAASVPPSVFPDGNRQPGILNVCKFVPGIVSSLLGILLVSYL